jgi:hypothetical protein
MGRINKKKLMKKGKKEYITANFLVFFYMKINKKKEEYNGNLRYS